MDEIVEKIRSAYDEVPYECNAYHQMHPNRLAVEAALRGLSALSIERCPTETVRRRKRVTRGESPAAWRENRGSAGENGIGWFSTEPRG